MFFQPTWWLAARPLSCSFVSGRIFHHEIHGLGLVPSFDVDTLVDALEITAAQAGEPEVGAAGDLNTILDQGIHVEGWDQAKAMDFMVKDAFQEEREAAGKWTRARVSSGQLACTMSAGRSISAFAAMRKRGPNGGSAAFNLLKYHDAVLSHGSLPARFVRALMFNEPIA